MLINPSNSNSFSYISPMKIKTFWTIFLKIIGLCFLVGIAKDLVFWFVNIFQEYSSGNSDQLLLFIVFLILMLGFYLFILKLLFFRTDWLIDKLKLDKGFTEENIDLSIKFSTVLTLAIIVIGGLMFLDSLPLFCTNLFEYFKQQETFRNYVSSGTVVFHFVKTLIAVILFTNSIRISSFLEKRLFKDRGDTDVIQ